MTSILRRHTSAFVNTFCPLGSFAQGRSRSSSVDRWLDLYAIMMNKHYIFLKTICMSKETRWTIILLSCRVTRACRCSSIEHSSQTRHHSRREDDETSWTRTIQWLLLIAILTTKNDLRSTLQNSASTDHLSRYVIWSHVWVVQTALTSLWFGCPNWPMDSPQHVLIIRWHQLLYATQNWWISKMFIQRCSRW